VPSYEPKSKNSRHIHQSTWKPIPLENIQRQINPPRRKANNNPIINTPTNPLKKMPNRVQDTHLHPLSV
jgi:hypothetical protein